MRIRGMWRRLSIRRKTIVWLGTIIFVLLSMTGISAGARARTMSELARIQENDTRCYTVQEALEEERRAFELLIRENSQASRQRYADACAAAEAALGALPFDYAAIGEECYARTWSLRSGYEGYSAFRDAVVDMDPADPAYSARFYQVVQMQEDLAVYALRLGRATMQHGSARYRQTLRLYEALPVLNVILLLLSFLTVAGIFRLLEGSLIRPILEMSAQSRRLAENDFTVPDLSVRNDDEVGELILAFNRMKHATMDQIATLEEKNRIESDLHRQQLERLELEQNLDRTKLEMLKSQVNPHFLFNTLNMISCMARLEDAAQTDRMILSLSGIFRYNLRTKEQEVALGQELEALDDYIRIQQTRFEGRISYKKQILVDPWRVRLPSFTLQPIVENAFLHGLARREEGGRVFLRIWQEGALLYISIADNGVGMDARQLARLSGSVREGRQTGQGIGLGNISRRIAMLYPEGDLRIYSRPQRGTVIQCVIPQEQGGDV